MAEQRRDDEETWNPWEWQGASNPPQGGQPTTPPPTGPAYGQATTPPAGSPYGNTPYGQQPVPPAGQPPMPGQTAYAQPPLPPTQQAGAPRDSKRTLVIVLSVVGVLVILAAIALGWWAASDDSSSEKSDSSAAAGGAGQESSSPEYVDIYRDRLPTCDKGQDPSGGACTAPGLNQLPPGVEEVAQGLMIHDLTCLSPVDGDCKAIPDAFVKAAADAAGSMTQGDPMPQELDLVAETSSGTEEFSCKWGTFSAEPQHKKTQWECRAHDRSA